MNTNNYGLPSPLTEQAIFDKAAKHLLRQGRKSLLHGMAGSCAYRGHDGTTCAVGILISDEQYRREMEGAAAFRLVNEFLPDLAPFESLLTDLQSSHDDWVSSVFDNGQMKARLARLADRHGLSTAVLYSAEPAQPWSTPQATELTPPELPDSLTRLLAPNAEAAEV